MATALTAQLAQIRDKSTHPLNLEEKKRAHSQSLLFDPVVAASQDFDTLFRICRNGFDELCLLDARFEKYSRSLFSPESVHQDRTQLNDATNRQIDKLLESFFVLVSSRVLMQSALKSVEWLIRRFSPHLYNNNVFVLAFLPYYHHSIFSSVLSLLPEDKSSKFLRPYIKSLACPPYHIIVQGLSYDRHLLSSFNEFVLRCCICESTFSDQTSLWSSIFSGVIMRLYDACRSSSRKRQDQSERDLLMFIVPLLNDALLVNTPPQFVIAKYQVVGVFVSQAALESVVLQALAETVVASWAPPNQAGLLCLSVLSTYSENLGLSVKVIDFLLGLESLVEDLLLLRERYDLDKLMLGLVAGIFQQIKNRQDVKASVVLRRLSNSLLIEGSSKSTAHRLLQEAMNQPRTLAKMSVQLRENLEDIARGLSTKEPSLVVSDSRIFSSGKPFELIKEPVEDAVSQEEFDAMVSRIPTRTAHETSFLSNSRSFIFQSLEDTFCKVSGSDELVHQFAELSVLRRSLGMKEPLFISFFVRLWCGKLAASVRTMSVRVIIDYLEEGISADPQFLLTYILQGLLDPSPQVRKIMAGLAIKLQAFYTQSSHPAGTSDIQILGESDIYGPGNASHSISWLSIEDIRRFLEICILPVFQDDSWEPTHAFQIIVEGLKGVHRPQTSGPVPSYLKSSTRSAILVHLCTHIMNTPLYAVKTTLLHIVTQVGKVGSQSCSKVLYPLLKTVAELGSSVLKSICAKESIDLSETLSAVANTVTHNDYDGIMCMRSLIESGSITRSSPEISAAFLKRLRTIFPSVRPDWQVEIVSSFLDRVLLEGRDTRSGSHFEWMHKALSSLPMSSQCLAQTLRYVLPSEPSSDTDSSKHKRRRLSPGAAQDDNLLHRQKVEMKTRKLMIVLEITDKAGIEYDSSLLVILSQLLANLGSPIHRSSQDTSYLQTLLLDRMLTLAKASERTQGLQLDGTKLNTEAVIGCVRETANLQTRNTGLLLLSVLARTLPEHVLHSIMPVFTSMGTHKIHHDDHFSSHVVRQTLESIIPPLLKSLQKRKSRALGSISNLLAGFAAAFNHMPPQIRFDTYTLLINKIGQDSYLYILIALLVKAHPKSKKVLQFAGEIVLQYSIVTQLSVIGQYLDLVLDLLKSTPEKALDILSLGSRYEHHPTAVGLLDFIPTFLSGGSVVGDIQYWLSENPSTSSTRLGLIEESLDKAFTLSQMSEIGSGGQSHLTQPLDSLLDLLPLPYLVDVLNALLKRTTEQSRLHILRTLQIRLDTAQDVTSSKEPCLRMLVLLSDMLSKTTEPSLSVLLSKCIGKIVHLFGRKNTEAVTTSIQRLSDPSCLRSPNIEVRCQSLLGISSAIEAVGEALMPLLPHILSSCLDTLDDSMALEKYITLHNACCVCLCSILVHSALVMTGSNLDRFIALSGKSACLRLGDEADIIRGEALSLMSLHTDPGDCLSALNRTWRSAMLGGFPAMVEHLSLVKSIVQRLSKSRVSNLQERLEDIIIQILDLRHSQSASDNPTKYTTSHIDAMEDSANEITLLLVYKLNDATFRPFFNHLLEWAFDITSENPDLLRNLRRLTLYHFLSAFFDNLKSVVTSYASYLLADIATILSDARTIEPGSRLLWRRVIQTLRIMLQHDQDDFYQNPSHFSPIASALLGQIATAEAPLIQEEIIPTIVELATAVESSEQYKEINSALLQHMRSSKATTRLSAVRCQHALVNRLGHDWLALLPEMLPLISELQEDDDENVENETLRWMAKIEERTGESLAPMLR